MEALLIADVMDIWLFCAPLFENQFFLHFMMTTRWMQVDGNFGVRTTRKKVKSS